MKTCTAEGCKNPVFSNLYCKYHQYIRKKQGGDLFKRKPRQKSTIPKESKKRKEEHKYYAEHCKDLTAEIKSQNDGKIFCFFSGIEITGRVTYHHLRGRTGKYYTDKEWLVPCINDYHIDYHFKDYGWLNEQDWYVKTFLPNLNAKSEELYRKELRKGEKTVRLNPEKELFDED
jgi:hypothetical protein